ncbi:hypothetical protein A4A49_60807, partial [Nicotiana attenuata]
MGRGRPKRVIQITNTSKESKVEQTKKIDDMQKLPSSMEQLQSTTEMWPPLHGVNSARSTPIDKGEQSKSVKQLEKVPITEKIEVEKVIQRKEVQQTETMKLAMVKEAQILKN